MPKPGSQSNGTVSKRGRLNEGRPTKKTSELVARVAEAISFGLIDKEVCELIGIDKDTLIDWKKDPEFFGQIKPAVALRHLKRLQKIESGEVGWQGAAWLAERLMPHRYAKPEVQISLNNAAENGNGHQITIKLADAREIESRSEPIRETVSELLANYQKSRGVAETQG
jgi:hypothetical protein